MLNRLALLLCTSVFIFLAACGGSKGSGAQSSGGTGKGEGLTKQDDVPKVDELKKAHEEAVSITEENHNLAREIFDLQNKLNVE